MFEAEPIPVTDLLHLSSRIDGNAGRTQHHEFRPRILVLDDDRNYLDKLSENLEGYGFDVIAHSDSLNALSWFLSGGRCDVILLNWQIPQIAGKDLLRMLREAALTQPAIVLTDISSDEIEEIALASGAVDFIHKSRRFSILLRRIRVIVDRSIRRQRSIVSERAMVGDLSIDPMACRAEWRGVEVPLTITEFRIVQKLAARPGTDINYREIYDVVHGAGFQSGDGMDGVRTNVRSLIKRIRRKFKELDDGFDAITNYPGFGYRWCAAEENGTSSDQ